MECALLPTRHLASDVAESDLFNRGGATLRVLKEGVAAVDDGVARVQDFGQRVDGLVHRRPRVHHHEHRTRWFQDRRQLL